MCLLLGIDVSTTGVKALLVDERGTVVASETTAVPLASPKPLWSEQQPGDWWRGAVESIRRVLARPDVRAEAIAAIGLTGQMHGLVLLDERGDVLRPAILWNDQRTGAECDEMRAAIGRERLIRITGNDALTGFTAPKMMWVRRHEPDIYRRARTVLLPKDYVRFRLTDERSMDKADGSGTLLFDLARRNWSPDVAEAIGVPREWLPPTFEGPEVSSQVSAAAAQETGLRAGTPVVAGAGDQAAGAVGVGAVEPGIVSAVLGTSGVVFVTTDAPAVEPEGRLHAFCHALPNRWHLMGVMLSAAGSLQWYRDTLAPAVSFDALMDEAAAIGAGAEGLLFLPYLTGERTPHPDPLARGAFVGLTRRHTRAHLTRAVLEGVAFGLRNCFDLISKAAGAGGLGSLAEARNAEVERPTSDLGRRTSDLCVRISGGGARSALWRRIVASALATDVERVNSTEGAAYGAALLAGVGAGIWRDVETACRETITVTGVDEPDAAWQERYEMLHAIYDGLYPALAATFAAVTR